jgi:hypothetical protein
MSFAAPFWKSDDATCMPDTDVDIERRHLLAIDAQGNLYSPKRDTPRNRILAEPSTEFELKPMCHFQPCGPCGSCPCNEEEVIYIKPKQERKLLEPEKEPWFQFRIY